MLRLKLKNYTFNHMHETLYLCICICLARLYKTTAEHKIGAEIIGSCSEKDC
jgi:hypothetical protein